MARLRIGGFRPYNRPQPGSSNEIRIAAKSPAQKALIGVMMILFGGYALFSGDIGIGRIGGVEITGTPVLLIGGCLVAWGLYLTVMNAFTGE